MTTTTTNQYIAEAFEAFVQAVRDGYGHRGAEALSAAYDGDYSSAMELEGEHESLMSTIGNIVQANANATDRMVAHDTGVAVVALLTPEMTGLSILLETHYRDDSEMTDKGAAFLAAMR
jgi:hypothetical protein